MAKGSNAPLIIKKVKRSKAAAHHGGAWKVAYADFVTAMMSFFLLLWLLNVTTDIQKRGIADYFEPTIASPANLPSMMSMVDGARPSTAKVIWPFSIGLPLNVTLPLTSA